jgi:hypothetical protein
MNLTRHSGKDQSIKYFSALGPIPPTGSFVPREIFHQSAYCSIESRIIDCIEMLPEHFKNLDIHKFFSAF